MGAVHGRASRRRLPAGRGTTVADVAPGTVVATVAATRRPPRPSRAILVGPHARPGAPRRPRIPSSLVPPRSAAAATEGHRADLAGLVAIAAGLLCGLGVYLDAAGPFGRVAATAAGSLLGAARVLVPPALLVGGVLLIRGRAEPADDDCGRGRRRRSRRGPHRPRCGPGHGRCRRPPPPGAWRSVVRCRRGAPPRRSRRGRGLGRPAAHRAARHRRRGDRPRARRARWRAARHPHLAQHRRPRHRGRRGARPPAPSVGPSPRSSRSARRSRPST